MGTHCELLWIKTARLGHSTGVLSAWESTGHCVLTNNLLDRRFLRTSTTRDRRHQVFLFLLLTKNLIAIQLSARQTTVPCVQNRNVFLRHFTLWFRRRNCPRYCRHDHPHTKLEVYAVQKSNQHV